MLRTASARVPSGLRPPSPTRCLADSALHCVSPTAFSPAHPPPLAPTASSAHGETPFRMTAIFVKLSPDPYLPLVPKLRLGNALVPEALLRRRGWIARAHSGAGAGQQSFPDKCATRLELGHERQPCPSRQLFPSPRPQVGAHLLQDRPQPSLPGKVAIALPVPDRFLALAHKDRELRQFGRRQLLRSAPEFSETHGARLAGCARARKSGIGLRRAAFGGALRERRAEWLPHSPYATAGGRPGPVTFEKATIDLSPCRAVVLAQNRRLGVRAKISCRLGISPT